MRRTRSLLAVGCCTAAVVAFGAGPALAGEETGSGKKEDQNQGVSWCSFSGLNDQLPGEGPTDSKAQSYGQELVAGLQDPPEGNPGTFCNPNRTPLPPQPKQKQVTELVGPGRFVVGTNQRLSANRRRRERNRIPASAQCPALRGRPIALLLSRPPRSYRRRRRPRSSSSNARSGSVHGSRPTHRGQSLASPLDAHGRCGRPA
jgi:hypothetical protein